MEPERSIGWFGPAPGLAAAVGVVVLGTLGALLGLIVGISHATKSRAAIIGLILGVLALVWQQINAISSGSDPLKDPIIILSKLLGLPLIGILLSAIVESVHSGRMGLLRSR